MHYVVIYINDADQEKEFTAYILTSEGMTAIPEDVVAFIYSVHNTLGEAIFSRICLAPMLGRLQGKGVDGLCHFLKERAHGHHGPRTVAEA